MKEVNNTIVMKAMEAARKHRGLYMNKAEAILAQLPSEVVAEAVAKVKAKERARKEETSNYRYPTPTINGWLPPHKR